MPDRPAATLYAETPLPTGRGPFRMCVYRDAEGREHVAMVRGEVRGREGVPVRLHSECLTSEVLGSLKCDCREQLDHALDLIAKADVGVVVYLRQEGRGIGLGNKARAYALQAQGLDTFEANRRLGFADDLRTYDVATAILRDLGVVSVDLITNNPDKLGAVKAAGIPLRRRIASIGTPNEHSLGYLAVKRDNGHLIDLGDVELEKAG